MRKLSPARQPSAKSLGVLPWQRDFWLLSVEHVLAERLGPPELARLDGFSAPAVTQYTVTTPDLLRSFRRYNAGKPYHRQVRPFGFMVMFQRADDTDLSTMMRVIAPFNRNPAKAARKAFDRDTGATARFKELKTYAKSLRTYYNHPEAKFLNGERGDRGPTGRRHVIAKSIIHIGKEANKLDPQAAMGIDPTAQVEFGAVSKDLGRRMRDFRMALEKFGPTRIARRSSYSRQYLSKLTNTQAVIDEATLSVIEQAIAALDAEQAKYDIKVTAVFGWLRTRLENFGLRQLAAELNLSIGYLSRILAGKRPLPSRVMSLVSIRLVQERHLR